jgi:hypothetical protein
LKHVVNRPDLLKNTTKSDVATIHVVMCDNVNCKCINNNRRVRTVPGVNPVQFRGK